VTNPDSLSSTLAGAYRYSDTLPSISSLSPNRSVVGGAAFTLTVNGRNFVSGSTVRWNGAGRTTTFVSATQLTAQIPASDLATIGDASVTVLKPDGSVSEAGVFEVAPKLSIEELQPSSTGASTVAFTLWVVGTDFVSGSTVHWNGSPRPTMYWEPWAVSAEISDSDIATAGTATITVVAPDGSVSNPATFTINVKPSIMSLSLTSVSAGSPDIVILVTGANFREGAWVAWNGLYREARLLSNTVLAVQIPASDLTTAGSVTVRVYNPDAGESNPLTFTISP
jgi:hypothetical protein